MQKWSKGEISYSIDTITRKLRVDKIATKETRMSEHEIRLRAKKNEKKRRREPSASKNLSWVQIWRLVSGCLEILKLGSKSPNDKDQILKKLLSSPGFDCQQKTYSVNLLTKQFCTQLQKAVSILKTQKDLIGVTAVRTLLASSLGEDSNLEQLVGYLGVDKRT